MFKDVSQLTGHISIQLHNAYGETAISYMTGVDLINTFLLYKSTNKVLIHPANAERIKYSTHLDYGDK